MAIRITASELARSLADILNRAAYQGESFEIERGGRRLVLKSLESKFSREALGEALATFRARHPDGDPTFAKEMERVRELTNCPMEVKNPWER